MTTRRKEAKASGLVGKCMESSITASDDALDALRDYMERIKGCRVVSRDD